MKITRTYMLLCSLFFSTVVFAQNAIIDSLQNELSIHTQRDTTRVNSLNLLAYNYRKCNISIAEEKSIEANNLTKELHYAKGLVESILIFSKIYISKAEYSKALIDALKSLKLYQETDSENHKRIISVYNTLGMISSYQNDPDISLDYFTKSLHLAKEYGDVRSQGDALGNIGITYYKKGEYENASNFYKKGIAIYEASGDTKRTLTPLRNLASIFSIQGRYTEALKYYNKILILYREDNKKDKIASTLQNIGIVYFEIGQHKKALTYFEESLQIHREIGGKLGIAINLNKYV